MLIRTIYRNGRQKHSRYVLSLLIFSVPGERRGASDVVTRILVLFFVLSLAAVCRVVTNPARIVTRKVLQAV